MDTNACRAVRPLGRPGDGPGHRRQPRVLEPGETARADFLHWAWQIKFEAAKNVAHVVDKMLHACGGSGYKRDMELERYVRDAKAGWVMGPTNEVLRQFVGKAVLLGFDALDYWNQTYNRRVVENEVKKLDPAGKRELAEQLVEQADEAEAKPRRRRRSMAVAARPALLLTPGLRPVDRSLESYWVRPGGGDRGAAAAGRPAHGARPRRRPGRRADRDRRRGRRGRRRARRPRRRRRRCCAGSSGRRRPTGCSATRRGPAPRTRAAPVRRRHAAGRRGELRRRARRHRDRRRAGRPGRRRRLARVGARGRDPARAAPNAARRSSCRRRWPSRGSTSASTRRPRSPTRSRRASTSRSSTSPGAVLGLPRLPPHKLERGVERGLDATRPRAR